MAPGSCLFNFLSNLSKLSAVSLSSSFHSHSKTCLCIFFLLFPVFPYRSLSPFSNSRSPYQSLSPLSHSQSFPNGKFLHYLNLFVFSYQYLSLLFHSQSFPNGNFLHYLNIFVFSYRYLSPFSHSQTFPTGIFLHYLILGLFLSDFYPSHSQFFSRSVMKWLALHTVLV